MSSVILQALSPRVVVFSTNQVKEACRINGLKNLDELFRPWQDYIEKVSILSAQLTPTVHPYFAVRFVSHEALLNAQDGGGGAIPYSPEVVVDIIANLISHLKPEDNLQYRVLRDIILASSPIAEHETFGHPLSYMFASTTESEDPVADLHKLHAAAVASPVCTSRPYIDGSSNTIQKFWLLIHDVAKDGTDITRPQQAMLQIRKAFGPHSGLLVINSKLAADGYDGLGASAISDVYSRSLISLSGNDPFKRLGVLLSGNLSAKDELDTRQHRPIQPRVFVENNLEEENQSHDYAARLSESDIDAIRAFLREFVSQSLVPWMESRVREWNEVYIGSRRGLTGRLFGAGRKLFGSGRSTPTQNLSYNSIRGYYPPAAPETISRKLADLAFMLRDYRLATTVYDSIRRDYAQDGAIRLSASATEMYGISLLMGMFTNTMQPDQRIPNSALISEVHSVMEQSIAMYTTRSHNQLDGIKACILYLEAYTTLGNLGNRDWSPLSRTLVKAASQAEEVPGAVLLEQAAELDRLGTKKLLRKHAFHLVMAARRYEHSGQKSFSGSCLEKALHHYRGQQPGWSYAQRYLEYALGRQAYTLGDSSTAVEHFLQMLRGGSEIKEDQSGIISNLDLAYQQLRAKLHDNEEGSELVLDRPLFQATGALISFPLDDGASLFPPAYKHMGSTDTPQDRSNNVFAIDEPFNIRLQVKNPLQATLRITDISLSYKTELGGEDAAQDIFTERIPDIDILAANTYEFEIGIKCSVAKEFRIDAVNFRFHGLMQQKETLTGRGKRLFETKAQLLEPTYSKDDSLAVKIVDRLPRLSARITPRDNMTMSGGQAMWKLELSNTGTEQISGIELNSNLPWRQAVQDNVASEVSGHPASLTPFEISLSETSLAPGAGLSSDIIYRSSEVGTFSSVFEANFQASNGEKRSIHFGRVLEISDSLDIKPALQGIKHDVTKTQLLLSVTNKSDKKVILTGIYALSRYWAVMPAPVNRPLHVILTPGQVQQVVQTLEWIALPHVPVDRHSERERKTTKAMDPRGDSADEAFPSTEERFSHNLTARTACGPEVAAQAIFPKSLEPRLTVSAASHQQYDRALPLLEECALRCGLEWQSEDGNSSGIVVVERIPLLPQHSPLLPGLLEMLKADKASVRAMYEETNKRRRDFITNLLTGDLAKESNPLSIECTFQTHAADILACTFTFRMINTSPIYEVRYRLEASSTSRRRAIIVGASQSSFDLAPLATRTWQLYTRALQSGHTLGLADIVWNAQVSVGKMSNNTWQERAVFGLHGSA